MKIILWTLITNDGRILYTSSTKRQVQNYQSNNLNFRSFQIIKLTGNLAK